jgi:hypothetical protein
VRNSLSPWDRAGVRVQGLNVINNSMLIAFLTGDLVFPSRIRPIAERLGANFQTFSGAENLAVKLTESADESIVLIDLSSGAVDPAVVVPQLKALANPPRAIVAFGPHVHEAKLSAARAAGCDFVMTRGQFDAQGESLLQQLAQKAG